MGGKTSKQETQKGPATIRNRRASFDYEFVATYEAGIMLVGCEVKSVFNGRANLTDAYCDVKDGELWIHNLDIEPYAQAVRFTPDRRRDRKLLMHAKEIALLARRTQEKGLALIPVKVYFNHGKVKVEVALARGKRKYDKREAVTERDQRRELDRSDTYKY